MNSLLLVQNPPVTRPRERSVESTRTRQKQQFEASTQRLPSQFKRVKKALSQQTQMGDGGVGRGKEQGRGRGEGRGSRGGSGRDRERGRERGRSYCCSKVSAESFNEADFYEVMQMTLPQNT